MNWVRKYFLFVFTILMPLGNSCSNSPSETDPQNIEPVQSDHLTFELYDGLSHSITYPVCERMNQDYDRILNHLDVKSMPRVKVEIWNDETHFQNDMYKDIGMNYPGTYGYVYSKTCIRLLNRGDLAQNTIHEFSHLVSLYVNSNFANNPRWFWEAVAIYEAGEFIHPKNISYLAAGNFPSIEELNSDFNSGNRKIYEIGYILSEYILENWDRARFIQMIKQNANLQAVLNVTTDEFESGWKSFVNGKYF
jgi:hypothetical protein